jgi:hypothetical protein
MAFIHVRTDLTFAGPPAQRLHLVLNECEYKWGLGNEGTMELEKQVRRVDSFLNRRADVRWQTVSNAMAGHTEQIMLQNNPFFECQTADQFCTACDTIAHKICGGGLFSFTHKYRRFTREITKRQQQQADVPKGSKDDQMFQKKLVAALNKEDPYFIESVRHLVSNMKTAFYLYFYAGEIRKEETNLEQQLKYADALCGTQSAATNFNNHTQLTAEVLGDFPLFSQRFSSIDVNKNPALFSFIASCVVLPWSDISDKESADRTLCTIIDSVCTARCLGCGAEGCLSMDNTCSEYPGQLGCAIIVGIPTIIGTILYCIYWCTIGWIFDDSPYSYRL